MDLDSRLIQPTPSPRQVRIQEMGFYAFIHFTVNTFTDREWGDGTESPGVFDPKKADPDQWVRAVRDAGMKGLILTCKHHDGFCLWDSGLTDHTVMESPYGRDLVKETAEACRRGGIAFGVYLSPWDRHSPLYGSGRAYDDYFVGQLTELLTGYGEVFSVWFDGACGEGPNGKKQVYDWDRYYDTVRRLQPGACISVCGPDVRWCGNEAGHTRPAEWSVVPLRARDSERIAERSQQEDSEEFRRRVDARDQDLGSREVLKNETELIWYPAEVNTSIRPGWFWHERENDRVRSAEELFDIYLKSVGGNAMFLLNIPPDRDGLIHERDLEVLGALGEKLRRAFRENVLPEGTVAAREFEEGFGPENVLTDSYESCFKATGPACELTLTLREPRKIGYLTMKENVLMSQRIESFAVDVWREGRWAEAAAGTVVGFRRIVPLGGARTDRLRIRIKDSRKAATLSFVGVYAV